MDASKDLQLSPTSEEAFYAANEMRSYADRVDHLQKRRETEQQQHRTQMDDMQSRIDRLLRIVSTQKTGDSADPQLLQPIKSSIATQGSTVSSDYEPIRIRSATPLSTYSGNSNEHNQESNHELNHKSSHEEENAPMRDGNQANGEQHYELFESSCISGNQDISDMGLYLRSRLESSFQLSEKADVSTSDVNRLGAKQILSSLENPPPKESSRDQTHAKVSTANTFKPNVPMDSSKQDFHRQSGTSSTPDFFDQLAQMKADNEILSAKNRQLSSENHRLTEQLKMANISIDTLQGELNHYVQDALGVASKSISTNDQAVQRQIQALQEEIQQSALERDELSSMLQTAIQRLEEKTHENRDYASKDSLWKSETTRLREMLQNADSDAELRYRSQLQDLSQQLKQSQDECTSVKIKLEESRTVINNLNEHIQKLKTSGLEGGNDDAFSFTSSARDGESTSALENERLRQLLSTSETRCRGLTDKNKELSKQNQYLNDQVRRLNQLVVEQQQQLVEQRSRLQVYTTEVTELKEHMINGKENEMFALVSDVPSTPKTPKTPQKTLAIAYQRNKEILLQCLERERREYQHQITSLEKQLKALIYDTTRPMDSPSVSNHELRLIHPPESSGLEQLQSIHAPYENPSTPQINRLAGSSFAAQSDASNHNGSQSSANKRSADKVGHFVYDHPVGQQTDVKRRFVEQLCANVRQLISELNSLQGLPTKLQSRIAQITKLLDTNTISGPFESRRGTQSSKFIDEAELLDDASPRNIGFSPSVGSRMLPPLLYNRSSMKPAIIHHSMLHQDQPVNDELRILREKFSIAENHYREALSEREKWIKQLFQLSSLLQQVNSLLASKQDVVPEIQPLHTLLRTMEQLLRYESTSDSKVDPYMQTIVSVQSLQTNDREKAHDSPFQLEDLFRLQVHARKLSHLFERMLQCCSVSDDLHDLVPYLRADTKAFEREYERLRSGVTDVGAIRNKKKADAEVEDPSFRDLTLKIERDSLASKLAELQKAHIELKKLYIAASAERDKDSGDALNYTLKMLQDETEQMLKGGSYMFPSTQTLMEQRLQTLETSLTEAMNKYQQTQKSLQDYRESSETKILDLKCKIEELAVANDSLSAVESEQRTEIRRLRMQLAALQEDCRNQANEVQEVLGVTGELQNYIENLMADLNRVSQDRDGLAERLQAKEDEIADLANIQKQVMDIIDNEQGRNAKSLAEAQREIDSYKERIQKLEQEVETYKERLDVAGGNLQKLEGARFSAVATCQALRNELIPVKQEIDRLKEENEELREKLKTQSRVMATEILPNPTGVENLLQERASLQQVLDTTNDLLREATSTKTKLDSECAVLRKRLDEEAAQNYAHMSRLHAISKQSVQDLPEKEQNWATQEDDSLIEALQVRDQEKPTVSQMATDIVKIWKAVHLHRKKLAKEKQQLMAALTEMTAREKKLLHQVSSLSQGRDHSLQKYESARTAAHATSAALQESNARTQELSKTLAEVIDKRRQVEQDLIQTRNLLTSVQANLEISQKAAQQVQGEYQGCAKELEASREENSRLATELTNAKAEIHILQSELESTRKTLASVQSMQTEINETLGVSLKSKNTFARKISSMQTRIDILEGENKTLQAKYEEEVQRRQLQHQQYQHQLHMHQTTPHVSMGVYQNTVPTPTGFGASMGHAPLRREEVHHFPRPTQPQTSASRATGRSSDRSHIESARMFLRTLESRQPNLTRQGGSAPVDASDESIGSSDIAEGGDEYNSTARSENFVLGAEYGAEEQSGFPSDDDEIPMSDAPSSLSYGSKTAGLFSSQPMEFRAQYGRHSSPPRAFPQASQPQSSRQLQDLQARLQHLGGRLAK
eukprot:TRINITY_DN7766_c0_g1_i1.p1 TRINITY_DN7766_c0_g1~~TRINITY_DN7766_c0_g1_i1.p1  ORF type:complete len:1850 (+),score=441.70 TRINITY_DN7766_c0_g1_i1:63-5612(+)